MSSPIMKYMFGADADISIYTTKATHNKSLGCDKMRTNKVYHSVKYFDNRFRRHRAVLKNDLDLSRKGAYTCHLYTWCNKHNKIMK